MAFDQSLIVVVHRRQQLLLRVALDSGSALIGSGGHCDVRLPPDVVALEQLFIELQAGGVFAEARAQVPQVLVEGVPFSQGRVLLDRHFNVGELEIRVEVVEAQSEKRDERRVRPAFLLLAALLLPLGGFAMAERQRKLEVDSDYMSAPPLFDAKGAICTEGATGSPTLATIEGWLQEAEGLHERAPFSAEDGVVAVRLYRKTAACLGELGRETDAFRVRDGADALARKLEAEFHVHRVRLALAIGAKDVEGARREVTLLRRYLGNREDRFSQWLDYLDRKLGLQKTKGKKKKGHQS